MGCRAASGGGGDTHRGRPPPGTRSCGGGGEGDDPGLLLPEEEEASGGWCGAPGPGLLGASLGRRRGAAGLQGNEAAGRRTLPSPESNPLTHPAQDCLHGVAVALLDFLPSPVWRCHGPGPSAGSGCFAPELRGPFFKGAF
uniref:uncharacterized protein LOC114599894 n=1 Tax=Podarcis muralis TaxID=64176 RepID=UPI00109FE309|nr:uncharacterized protein LOC114599894 [Podarcis muralis]